MFLVNHPAWSWQTLQDTPYRVVQYLSLIDGVHGRETRKAKRAAGQRK